MSDDSSDPIRPWSEPFADLPEPVEDTVRVDQVVDACVVRAVKFASPIRDARGQVIPLGGVIFTFGNSETKEDGPPISYIGTPDLLRRLGKTIAQAAYRAANLAEGKP